MDFLVPEGDDRFRHFCANCNTIFYSNPKIVVGCLPIFEDKVLLCRRAISPRKGFWNLPAGFMENGETLVEGALRETWEESRAAVDIIKLHCIYNLPRANQVYFHFLAKMKSPSFQTTFESSEVELFKKKDIPWDDIAFSSTIFALEKYFEFGEKENVPLHTGEYLHQNPDF